MNAKELMNSINDDHPECRIAVAVTGGGTSAIGEMLRYGGSSNTVVYAHVPYAPECTAEYLGRSPDKLCSAETARQLAMRAYHDVASTAEEGTYPVGVGATSALGKITKERKGREHKIYVAVQNAERTTTYTLFLTAPRTREEEEVINTLLILHALGKGCNVKDPVVVSISPEEYLYVKTDEGECLSSILEGHFSLGLLSDGVVQSTAIDDVRLLLPGSFNPIHEGHREMARIASGIIGATCHYEMSMLNADKPPLDFTEVYLRVDKFEKSFEENERQEGEGSLLVTRFPTFLDKARHFSNITFAVGADTVERICDPRFYGGSQATMLAALTEMRRLGVKFLCFARKINGLNVEAYDSGSSDFLPQVFRDMSMLVPSSVFVSGLSSTEIRKSKN